MLSWFGRMACFALLSIFIFSGVPGSQASSVAPKVSRASLLGAPVNMNGFLDTNASLSFPDWFAKQTEIAGQKMIANISPPGTARGVVIASPSRFNPNYFYFWVRDAALAMNVITQFYQAATGSNKLQFQNMMSEYVDFSRLNQLTPTLTGAVGATNLGEPKFNVDGSDFNVGGFDGWCRPQNDSPALRALTLTRYANLLLTDGQGDYVRSKLYAGTLPAQTVIKSDLEYVAHHWQDQTCDLWEEVRGDHFYTRLVQMAALQAGGDLAAKLGDNGGASFYHLQAQLVHQDVENFWDPNRNIFQVTLNRTGGLSYKSSGLDSSVILAVLHAGFVPGEFSVGDERILSTASKLETSFASLYGVNDQSRFPGLGTAIGRYPEDTFSGHDGVNAGNPWFLLTSAFAELHYRLGAEIKARGSFTITNLNSTFIANAVGTTLNSQPIRIGQVISSGTPEFTELVQKIVLRGDAFLKRVRMHANPDGSLGEQIDRNTGYQVSARDLTWSYAGFVTASWARP